ncbi:MAG: galactose-1-phosphate uridylyltransferase [Planctomycetota bacterium]
MSELRHDPIHKQWVVIAIERSRRPHDFKPASAPPETGRDGCPFCPGHETKTPPEIFAVRGSGTMPNGPGWQVRVFANKFPALAIEGNADRRPYGPYDVMNGIGAHEVIVEAPEHDRHLADLSVEQIQRVLRAYRERLIDLQRDVRFKYILMFKNHGETAGATLAHPHSQVIATPITPKIVHTELNSCLSHFRVKERCLFCDILMEELREGARIVYADDHYVTLAPFASRFPFEQWILPRQHQHSFEMTNDAQLERLARVMKEILLRLKVGLSDPPYNFVLHSAPNTRSGARRSQFWDTVEYDYHWHLELIPRLTKVAGFEWGTGYYINSTPPEDAARYLRDVDLR